MKKISRFMKPKSKKIKMTRKGISQRELKTRKTLTALGAIPKRRRGAGRPEGSGKYQLMGYKDVYEYRRAMAQQKAIMRMRKQQEVQKLKRRGLSEEQINRLQLARTLEQQKMAIVPDSRRQMMQQAVNVADEEKDFARFRAQKTVSPNTQRMLTEIRRIQNKGEVDNIEQQRRIYEKRLIAEQGNLLKARNLFGPESNTMNILEVEGNILQAENVFRTEDNTNILRERRGNILDTNSHGNTLRF